MSWFTSIFGGKPANVLPTKNTSGKTAAPSNEAAVTVNVARPQQQLIPSRSASPVANVANANANANANSKKVNGVGASAPVMPGSKPNTANKATIINISGNPLVGGRRTKSKSKKTKSKSKKSKKTTRNRK
jgi:hypothetical protein